MNGNLLLILEYIINQLGKMCVTNTFTIHIHIRPRARTRVYACTHNSFNVIRNVKMKGKKTNKSKTKLSVITQSWCYYLAMISDCFLPICRSFSLRSILPTCLNAIAQIFWWPTKKPLEHTTIFTFNLYYWSLTFYIARRISKQKLLDAM